MLSPGDAVFLDGNMKLGEQWTVEESTLSGDLNIVGLKCRYRLKNRHGEVLEDVAPNRITGHWVET